MQPIAAALVLFAAASAAVAAPMKGSPVFCNVIMRGPPILANAPNSAVPLELFYNHEDNKAIVAPHGFTTSISYENGGIGMFQACHYFWLNIQDSPHSLKPLTFDYDVQTTHNWVKDANGKISAKATSTYGASSKFLVCQEGDNQVVYLQTGNDFVVRPGCFTTELFVGSKIPEADN